MALGKHLAIVSDGLLSLSEDDVGREMSFFDMNAALEMGLFGPKPLIAGDVEWSQFANHICAGMSFSRGGWVELEYHGQNWSTADTKRDRAPLAARKNLADLKRRATGPDAYIRHMRDQPKFEAV